MFDKFRHLLQYGEPDEFFSFANDYERVLHDKGYMMLYYKLLNNEGFFALRHNMVFRAMQAGERLNEELHNDGASQYYYLATGLMGDIYELYIYNRNGTLVFHTDDPTAAWQPDNSMPQGAYAYHLRLRFNDNKIHTYIGTVIIVK